MEASFSLERVDMGILVGVARHLKNVVAVVFDPNIEEALIYRLPKRPRGSRKLKTKEACNTLKHALNTREAKNVIQKIANAVIPLITRNPI